MKNQRKGRKDLPDELIKSIVLQSLSHDFLTPFRASYNLFTKLSELTFNSIEAKDAMLECEEDIEYILDRISRDIYPNLRSLYNDISSEDQISPDRMLFIIEKSVGNEINEVVELSRKVIAQLKRVSIEDKTWNAHILDLTICTRKIGNMLTSLQNLIKSKTHRKGEVRVDKTAEEIERMCQVNYSHEIPIIMEIEGEARLEADAAKIWIIFENLVSNAIKYSKSRDGSYIFIGLYKQEQSTVMRYAEAIQSRAEKDRAPQEQSYRSFLQCAKRHRSWVNVIVRDAGIGIPKERIWGIFKPYKQLSNQDYEDRQIYEAAEVRIRNLEENDRSNYGFGLSICQFFVRLHDGEIVVDATEGGPTVFSFWLPLTNGEFISAPTTEYPEVWWAMNEEQ